MQHLPRYHVANDYGWTHSSSSPQCIFSFYYVLLHLFIPYSCSLLFSFTILSPFGFTRSLLPLPLTYSRFPAGSKTNSNSTSAAELMEDKTGAGSIVLFFFFLSRKIKKTVASAEALPKFCRGAFAKALN